MDSNAVSADNANIAATEVRIERERAKSPGTEGHETAGTAIGRDDEILNGSVELEGQAEAWPSASRRMLATAKTVGQNS